MESHFLLRELAEVANGDYKPHQNFSYKKYIVKLAKKNKDQVDYRTLSTSELLKSKKYNDEIGKELKTRSFLEIIDFFESIPPLKGELYYWNPKRKINDALSFLMSIFPEHEILEKMKIAKTRSLIFHSKGFKNFESMLGQRISLGDLNVLEQDLEYFSKYWTSKKGKLAAFNEYLIRHNVNIRHSRKTIDVEQRIITHPYWCDDFCSSDWSFIRLPASRTLEFALVDCFSFLEIQINNRIITVSFAQFKGLIEKDKKFETFWSTLNVKYDEEIELF
ncbi:hypothetical protein M153_1650004407 [Pseudoloma neurophilia]|uniref:Uncharacterized protein n=1 Tax=Pseudoloma neurophilia TaxID=146866 RepID=A0A0R0LZS2_9MICR|nr:hypothetical protein M153_1650004407 [Pseudoloma neurophilia]